MSAAGILPHQVELLYDFEGAINPPPFCAGSIISSYLILTVFSCLAGKNESLIKIKANGKNQMDQIRTIGDVYSYAALDSDPSPFDVAVIRLKSKLHLDNLHTSKIPFDQSQVPVDDHLFCEASVGLRETEMNEVKTIDRSKCSQILEEREEKNFICTEPENAEGSSQPPLPLPLAGSSLICSDILYGIFSMNSSSDGENCGKRVYTSVGMYSHWIRFVFDDETEHQVSDPAFDVGATSFGGTEVDQIKHPVPYQLSIQFKGKHECGGVILDKRTALSAAHCFSSRNIPLYSVVAGEQNLNVNDTTEQIFHIEKLFKHPKYKNIFGGNDIAVIRIKGKFNFNERVSNVWISSTTTPDLQDVNGTTTGWGKTRTNGDPSPVLMSVELELLEQAACMKKWGFLRNSVFCGYNNFSNTCGGDSGGPLVLKNYEDGNGHGNGPHTKRDLLVGITSFGPRECEAQDQPNGFTNVAHFYEWIAETRSNSSCSPCHFQCFNGQCIHKDLTCDKKYDCDDGSDEKICSQSPVPRSNQTSCGKVEVDQTKNPVPYQLSIKLKGNHVCGGVILDKRTALSLAGCFISENMSEYTVVAGEINLNEIDPTEQILQIGKLVKHPKYKRNSLDNDIAVIHVKGEFRFSERVNNVWISAPSPPDFLELDFTGIATGWSRTRTHGQLSPLLHSVQLEIMDPQRCTRRWPFLTDSMFCGYNYFSNTCGGDAGGPLVIKNYVNGNGPHMKKDLLVGLSSFGPTNCEEKDQPNGFTNVQHFHKWIAEVRSNSLCSSSQFQCFNGECIDEEMKCDYKYDCEDESDEKVCSSYSYGCGGFIDLALHKQHEIIYQVPSKERQRDSVCLWVVSTGRQDSGASIEATILDHSLAQFDPDSDVLFTQYKFTLNNNNAATLNEMGDTRRIPAPFMTVYYRTTSLAPNAGFNLKLRDSTTQTQSQSQSQSRTNVTERLNVTLITLPNGHFGGTRKLTYPPSRNAIRRGVTYSRNERTFFILKPQKSGAKIRLDLTFLDTEQNYDWLQISTFRRTPVNLLRLSGRSNWTEKVFEGLENEPFLFYFHSDASVEKEGFKIQYSEIMPKLAPCGGFIRLEEEHELLYKVPENLRGEKSVCVWVVAAAEGASIELELLSNPRAHFEPRESDLYAIYNFRKIGFSHYDSWVKDQTWTLDKPFFVLYFRSTSSNLNSGFNLRLKEVGKIEEPKTVKYLELTSTPTDGAIKTFKYPPPPASKYADDERTFVIVKPAARQGKLKLDLKSVSTEKGYDWIDILSVNSEPTSKFRFDGNGSWSDRVFEAEEGEPLIIYFHSDEITRDAGFQFAFAEERLGGV